MYPQKQLKLEESDKLDIKRQKMRTELKNIKKKQI
mgnify:FL=1